MSNEGNHLSLKDVSVIAVLWAQDFVNIWIGALCAYTAFVFLSREQRSGSFDINYTLVFAVQCIAALIIAFLVDIGRLRKTVVSLIGLSLFTLTPFSALFTTMSDSLWSGMAMFWPCSVLFITLPVTYCLMFNQRLEPNSRQIRRMLSVLEMCNALIEWICFLTLPRELNSSSRYSVVFMLVISLPLVFTLLTLLERIRTIIKGDIAIDNSVKSVIDGLRSDLREHDHSGRSLKHVVLFSLLLLPQMSLLVIGSVLDSTSDEDTEPQDPILVNLFFAFRLLSIPLMEVILAMTQVNEHKADYTVLVIVHVLNIVILVLIVTSMTNATPASGVGNVERGYAARSKRDSFVEDIELPEPGQAAFVFINGHTQPISPSTSGPPTLLLQASVISPAEVEVKFMTPFSGRSPAPDGGLDTEFYITLRAAAFDSDKNRTEKIRWTGNRFHLFVFYTEDFTSDVLGLAHYEFVIKLREMSQVVVVNCYTLLVVLSELQITSADGSFKKTSPPPHPTGYLQTEIPPGKTTFTLKGLGDADGNSFEDISWTIVLNRYEVHVVYMSEIIKKVGAKFAYDAYMNTVRVFRLKEPTTTTTTATITTKSTSITTPDPSTASSTKKTPKIYIPSPQEVTVYSMAGAVMGTSSVSYTHFFWMESPLRLRATIFALFRVGGAVVWRLTPSVVVGTELTSTKVYSLLSIQVFTTIAHLTLGWIFDRMHHRRE